MWAIYVRTVVSAEGTWSNRYPLEMGSSNRQYVRKDVEHKEVTNMPTFRISKMFSVRSPEIQQEKKSI